MITCARCQRELDAAGAWLCHLCDQIFCWACWREHPCNSPFEVPDIPFLSGEPSA